MCIKPDYFKLDSNLEKNFRRSRQEVDIYFIATETHLNWQDVKFKSEVVLSNESGKNK